jgi:hypothetical protein
MRKFLFIIIVLVCCLPLFGQITVNNSQRTETTILQPHTFISGDALRFNGTNYVKGLADTQTNAEVACVVTKVVDAGKFLCSSAGWYNGFSGLTIGTNYLSALTAGTFSTTPPSLPNVKKIILRAVSSTSAFIDIDAEYTAPLGESTQIISATGNITAWNSLVLVNASLGSVLLTLPNVAGNLNQRIVVIKTDASANTVTINPFGGQTANAVSNVLDVQNASTIIEATEINTSRQIATNSVPLSSLRPSRFNNSIDNGSFTNFWDFTTATTQNPLTIQANALTTGSALSVNTNGNAVSINTTGRIVQNVGTTTTNTVLSVSGAINDFLELKVKNTSTGTQAQSGFTAEADNGSSTTGFAWMGINNSNFNFPTVYNVGGVNDVTYIGSGQDLIIANANQTKSIIFSTGRATTPFFNERMRITNAGNVGINTNSPSVSLDNNGSFGLGFVGTSAASYTVTATDTNVDLTLAGSQSVNLPLAVTFPRRVLTFVNRTSSAKTISSYQNSANVGSTGIELNSSLSVQSNGIDWVQISNSAGSASSSVRIDVPNLAVNGNILTAATSVDVTSVSTLSFTQTTANVSGTLLNPTNAVPRKVIVLENIGTADLTVASTGDNFAVGSGKSVEVYWNGTSWRLLNPAQVLAESGVTTLASQYIQTSATFTDVPSLSVTLPSAGKYEFAVSYTVRNDTSNAQQTMRVVNSVLTVLDSINSKQAIANDFTFIEVTRVFQYAGGAGELIKVQLASNGTATAQLMSDTNAGQTRIAWKKIGGFTPVIGQSIDYASSGTFSNTSGVSGNDLLWTGVLGNIPYNAVTGQFTLKAGKVYDLESAVRAVTFASPSTGVLQYSWTLVSGTPLPASMAGVGTVFSTANTNSDGSQPVAKITGYTPSVDSVVKVNISFVAGGAVNLAGAGSQSYVSIKQLGSTAFTGNTTNITNNSQTINTAGAVTINNQVRRVFVNPSTVLATSAITLPASPLDGDEAQIICGGTITANSQVVTSLTIAASVGQTLFASLTPNQCRGGDVFRYTYNASLTRWERF